MPMVEEYTGERLSLEGEHSIKAGDVINILHKLFVQRGEPDYIRSDNGPEFIAQALKEMPEVSAVKTLYIEPSEASFVGECILGDLHKQVSGRVIGESVVRGLQGSKGTVRGLPRWPFKAARVRTKALVMSGTDHGGRSPAQSPVGDLYCEDFATQAGARQVFNKIPGVLTIWIQMVPEWCARTFLAAQ